MKAFTLLIREEFGESGMSRAEFSRIYNIPLRTLEEWDAGRREPSRWAVDLLARAVLEDLWGELNPVFEVTGIEEDGDWWIEATTKSYTEAILTAREHAEKKDYKKIEIRYNIIETEDGLEYKTLNW